MNNRKSKSKKRKLSDLGESSGSNSHDKDDDLDSDTDERNSENGDEEGSVSDSSSSSAESQSSTGSSMKDSKNTKFAAANAAEIDSSDSGDETCDKCAICLRSITSQEVGNPEVCDHLFCSVCIIEWSKNSSACPLDRQQFSIILVRENKDGKIVRKVSVEELRTYRLNFLDLDDTVCEICGSGDREDIMLLCDICDRGFHTVCLTPPLENIPDENEWFCPDCDFRVPNLTRLAQLDAFINGPSTSQSLRPRVQMVRTRLLERIRVTVSRIVENYVLQRSGNSNTSRRRSISTTTNVLTDSDSTSTFDFDFDSDSTDEEPGPSRGRARKTEEKKSPTKTRKTRSKKSRNSSSKKTRRKRKTTKRKSTAGKKNTKKRKTRVKTTRTKKVKVENADGTVTEKIVKTRTYKRRRKQKPRKVKTPGTRRGLRVKSSTTPKTVKGRLALTLGMVPPKKPGQLLPDIKVRPPNSHMSAIDLNRARAGIPKLHIFAPRDELQYYSSDSDGGDFVGSSAGGVATVAQQRTNISRLQNRKKAALVLQSTPLTSSKPKPVIEPPPSEYVDVLGSILDSQAIWHAKKTNVKIKADGSIEVIRDEESSDSKAIPKPESGKKIDVRVAEAEGATTQAPMYPGAGSRPGSFRPYNRTYGDARNAQDNAFGPRSGQSSTGLNFNRFGGPARNESYANYLNSIPQGPTPFCRGGPPLRFRMPARQQLRRITFPARNRPAWQPEEEEENESEKEKEEKKEEEGKERQQAKPQEDDDIDLYSDIETNVEKEDASGAEDAASNYPALGPPPEPSPFLLGLDENGEFAGNKDKSQVYDPAEPCDSEEEMVIDENKEQTPERKEPEAKTQTTTAPRSPSKKDKSAAPKTSSEEDDEDCPIFSIYSSATREFSQKEEEEREREIAEERKKMQKMKLQGERKSKADSIDLKEVREETRPAGSEPADEVAEIVTSDLKKEEERKEKESSLPPDEEKELSLEESSPGRQSRSRSKSLPDEKAKGGRSSSSESEKDRKSKSPSSPRDKSSSPERTEKHKRSNRKSKNYDSDSEVEARKVGGGGRGKKGKDADDREDEEGVEAVSKRKGNEREDEDRLEKIIESDNETTSQKVATGLEGLDVEEVSSDNGDGAEFGDKRSLSSLSLSDLSRGSKRSTSPAPLKRRKKNKRRKMARSKSGKNYEEGEIDDSEKDNRLDESFDAPKKSNEVVGNENASKSGEKKTRKTDSGSERQILGSKENKKTAKEESKDKDLSWKKPSKKEKNYREGKNRSKERGRSRSGSRGVGRRKSRSPSPTTDKKKGKDRKKKTEKKKDIERYDVRKIVKNKEVRKTDAFGRDIVSKSRSITVSRSRSPIRERSRNMLRRDSRSYSRSRSRSFRRGRSPVRRRYLRTRSRSKSIRRSYSRSRSRSRSRKSKKKLKSKDRAKLRSRSRGRKSRSISRGRRRSASKSRSRSPMPRVVRGKKSGRSRRSWSHHASRSPSFSPRRSRSVTRSPVRARRSYSRSVSTSWSRGRSPLPRTSSLEKLTVVLTTKDKKWKKKKEGKKSRKEEKKRKKTGNSKEVFASGDNVLVSVNFRNNNNSTGNNSGSVISNEGRNARINSLSPVPATETSRKKKKGSDYENERVAKKAKKSNPISKKVVDVALSNSCPKRAKKLTRLSEKDAEVILNRKPVAVIDLDMSPYREQTPSPVNVVVVSDSGSGDEGKEHTPQRPAVRGTPGVEADKIQEDVGGQSVDASAPSSPLENGYVPTSGPKTPPEPQIKFSINKPQQLRQIANPLGDDDDDEEEEEEEQEEDDGGQRMESLDRRIEKELNPRSEMAHKGPNTPPAPRGPSTPKTPPSPQTSPDAYDPFEPTKSRSSSPSQADKENHPSPKAEGKEDPPSPGVPGEGPNAPATSSATETVEKLSDATSENHEDKMEATEKSEALPAVDCSSNIVIPGQTTCAPVSDVPANESPERKIAVVVGTPPSKTQTPAAQKAYPPVPKPLPMVSSASAPPAAVAAAAASTNPTVSSDAFSMPSPTKTSRSNATTAATTTTTTQTLQVSGIQRLQHRLGSPVNRTPNSVKSTPEKRATPRADANEILSSGNYKIRNASKRNGEQGKQPRPLQDATNETIDMTMDMDDSPYSPASSEGDDLFDPPVETAKPSQSNSKAASSYKSAPRPPHKSPVKQLSKFDLLFGPSGPALSPLKTGNKKSNAKTPAKAAAAPKVLVPKPQKKAAAAKKNVMHKMDEDQLRILDELPSSAVELQVKDKFLKKLNRQERVVDEVKTVLKPHYARKHITKEEYKDILRRSVPKICHSRSGEINPSKIQSLIEAYVRKFRHAKKKGLNAVAKPKVKKTMFS